MIVLDTVMVNRYVDQISGIKQHQMTKCSAAILFKLSGEQMGLIVVCGIKVDQLINKIVIK